MTPMTSNSNSFGPRRGLWDLRKSLHRLQAVGPFLLIIEVFVFGIRLTRCEILRAKLLFSSCFLQTSAPPTSKPCWALNSMKASPINQVKTQIPMHLKPHTMNLRWATTNPTSLFLRASIFLRFEVALRRYSRRNRLASMWVEPTDH